MMEDYLIYDKRHGWREACNNYEICLMKTKEAH
jgi:hypothetical protein